MEQLSANILIELELATPNSAISVQPLTGGVASDIARVQVGAKEFCVKFAIEKLRVEADWFAPLHRNAAEYEWLEAVGTWFPENVPKLFGRSNTQNGFVMECISGGDVRQWKSDLLMIGPRTGDAAGVGHLLGGIHAASASIAAEGQRFQNQADFCDLRIEPYLVSLIDKHADLSGAIRAVIQSLADHQTTLVHGDVSPKNILFRSGVPIILDAECATIGDPCFDAAFCLNHLLLKSIHLRAHSGALLREAHAFSVAYFEQVDWEKRSDIERRLCALLPMLMLARVDGKSPVEYLSDDDRERVRAFARTLIKTPAEDLEQLFQKLELART